MSGKDAFAYSAAPRRYVAQYRNGRWEEGELSCNDKVVISESAGILQYCQSVFEGLKARRTKDGRIVIFRPDMNIRRMAASCRRMCMPEYPGDLFLRALSDVVLANEELLPPYGEDRSMYIRPCMFATEPVLGVRPASEFEFRIFVSPVGAHFPGEVSLMVSDEDRAAPRGTGGIKAGLNYAMSMYSAARARSLGFDDNLYLDPATRTYVEETGGANVFFVTKDGKLRTPVSSSILPSITRDSVLTIARDCLGMDASEERITLDSIGDYAECGLCGTAAVIAPVGRIDDHGRVTEFFRNGYTEDTWTYKLKKLLTGMQRGDTVAPEGWLYEV